MKILERRKAEIEGLLTGADALPVVRLHPTLAEVYRLKVAELEVALNDEGINHRGLRFLSRVSPP